MYTQIHTCASARTQTLTKVRVRTNRDTRMHTYTHRLHTYMHAYVHTFITCHCPATQICLLTYSRISRCNTVWLCGEKEYLDISIYFYTQLCTHTHTHTTMHARTHTHTHTPTSTHTVINESSHVNIHMNTHRLRNTYVREQTCFGLIGESGNITRDALK